MKQILIFDYVKEGLESIGLWSTISPLICAYAGVEAISSFCYQNLSILKNEHTMGLVWTPSERDAKSIKLPYCVSLLVTKAECEKQNYFLILNKPFSSCICHWREILSDDSHRSRGNRGFVVKKVTSWSLFSAAGQTHL